MKPTVVFLEQQSWMAGAQRVLEAALDSIRPEYDCVVAFPDRGSFRATLEARGTETISLSIGTYRSGAKSWFAMGIFAGRSLLCGLKLAMVIRQRQVKLIYINGPRCLPAGVLASWLTGIPAVFHLHLVLDRRIELALVARLARHVSRILVCSRAAARPLLDRDPGLRSRTQVLYNPAPRSGNDRRHHERPVTDPFTLGVVGRITRTKGHHLLLEALGTLPSGLRQQIRVLIVGSEAPGSKADCRYASGLRAEVARLNLDRQVVWAGYQSDLDPWYASMDVLVHPALIEAMSVVVLEALQRGIPVIAGRTGGTPEAVRHGFNGLLVPVDDRDALAQAILLLFNDGAVRDRLHSGARTGLDRRFHPETFSKELRDALAELCPEKGSRLSPLGCGEA